MSLATTPQPAVRWADISKADLVIEDTIGGYWNTNASTVRQMLFERRGQPISVHMDSPGGQAYDGLAIYEMLRNHAIDAPVSVYIYGKCMSAASIVAMAASPGKLFAAPSAQLMVHTAKAGAYGNVADLQTIADALANIDQTMLEIYMRRTAQPEEKIRELMTDAGTFMTAGQALNLRLVDAIVEPPTALATLFTQPVASAPLSTQRPAPTTQPVAQASGTPPAAATPVKPTPKTPSKMEKELKALLGLGPEATLAEAEKRVGTLKRKARTEMVERIAQSGALGTLPKAMQVAFDDLVKRKPQAALDMLLANVEEAPAANASAEAGTAAKPKTDLGKPKPEATMKKMQAADVTSLIDAIGKMGITEAAPKTYASMTPAERKEAEAADPVAFKKLVAESYSQPQ